MPIVRVVYKPDKSVAVLHYSPKSKLSQEEAFAKMTKEAGLEGLDYEDLDSSQLPSREDRNAWEGEKGKGIKVNQAKAQQKKDAKERKRLIEEEKGKLAEQSLKDKGIIS